MVYGRSGRARRLAGAFGFGLSGRDAPLLALAGFLVRGGIVLLALPAVVPPSVIGLAEITGVRAISITGQPTMWLIEIAVVAALLAIAWLVVAGLVGALVDFWLVGLALTPQGSTRARQPLPGLSLTLRLMGIRLICLLPLAAALAWATVRIVDVTYAQLITPADLAQPLPLRVIVAAVGVVAVVVATWLATESIAAIAVRRQILAGDGIWNSLTGAIAQVVRRPFSSLLTVLLSYGASLAATALALIVASTAFDWCQQAARNTEPIAVRLGVGSAAATRDFRPVVFALAAAAMTLAWAVALVLSAVTSAWRSAAFTREVADDLARQAALAERPVDLAGLGLSGPVADRSGD
jgi:hypothetical protein